MWVWFTLFKVHFDSTHVLATLCFQKQLSCFASPHRSAIWRTILSAMHMSWHGGLQDTMFGDFEFIYDLIRRFSMKAPLNNCPGPENSFSARLTFPLFSHPSISFASLQVVVIRASLKKKNVQTFVFKTRATPVSSSVRDRQLRRSALAPFLSPACRSKPDNSRDVTRKESKVIQVCPSRALRKRTKKLIQLILKENLQDLSRQGTGRTRNSNPGQRCR